MLLNQRKYFCAQLASWLEATEWHYTTLLAAAIDSVDRLPDNIDQLINGLLQSYPRKPAVDSIFEYLINNRLLTGWFRFNAQPPKIKFFCLSAKAPTRLSSKQLPRLTNIGELADWLGVTVNQLKWLADIWRSDANKPAHFNHYHYSLIEKRSGGMRIIESPKTLLKEIQQQIYIEILLRLTLHKAAHGFHRQRSCLTHARNHVGQQFLLLFDIADFFQSIQWTSVNRVFINIGYAHKVANYLACLCTHRYSGDKEFLQKLDSDQRSKLKNRHLAQGAPTSPALSNIIMIQLDKRLSGLASSLGLNYSRYADDLAFSGNPNRNWRFFECLVGAICLEELIELNHRKTRLLKSSQRQKLTGIVVNNKLNIDRREYDNLKAVLFNCVKYGLDSQNRSGHANFRDHLLGRINHINSLNYRKGEKLKSMFCQIED